MPTAIFESSASRGYEKTFSLYITVVVEFRFTNNGQFSFQSVSRKLNLKKKSCSRMDILNVINLLMSSSFLILIVIATSQNTCP